MNDEPTTPEDADDTAGHILRGEAAQNPTTIGGRAPSVARDLSRNSEDDTEGHVAVRMVRNNHDEPTESDQRQILKH